MKRSLCIIGNGFDLAHNLPTKFDPDFMNIAKKYESNNFWDLYQSQTDDIWSDFEHLLARPDFNSLLEIFDGYEPDYLSDKESDRTGIIHQVNLNGKLDVAVKEFANEAEALLSEKIANCFLENIFTKQDLFINFNYTHTLEEIYEISHENILHIHGEVGKENLLLGYPEGEYSAEKYSFDVCAKGVGPFAEIDFEKYVNEEVEDYYTKTAYLELIDKTKSFSKKINISLLESFLNDKSGIINQIIVYGHSCAIDFHYFEYLNKRYPNVMWKFYVRNSLDSEQISNVEYLTKKYLIENYEMKEV